MCACMTVCAQQFTSIQEVQVKIVEGTSMCSAAGSVTKVSHIYRRLNSCIHMCICIYTV